ncbi:MAG TPA: peptidylprolyl isomerase [Rhodanobacteraceae bacterium]|nr:peptidylprolyl isomerase [Rhodanobacteraceae bacterium]
MQITDGRVASFDYTLTDESGEVIDTSEGRGPLSYLHGGGQIVPGLEQELAGKAAGDHFEVDVAPERGYGPHHAELVQTMPRSAFRGIDTIEPGMHFQASGAQGTSNVVVTKVDDDKVTIDGNHPLAGKTLHFDVAVTDVREASEDERNSGQVA